MKNPVQSSALNSRSSIVGITRIANRARFQRVLLTVGVPIAAITLFLVIWSAIAASVKVSFGSLPGPLAVWTETKSLWDNHRAEQAKKSEFYKRQAERKKEFFAKNPDREWKERKYSGSP